MKTTDFFEAAALIRERLAGSAERISDGSVWWPRVFDTSKPPAPNAGIWEGRAGTALFLAAFSIVDDRPATRSLALEAYKGLLRMTGDSAQLKALWRTEGLGLQGAGSLVYALATAAEFLGEVTLLDAAVAMSDALDLETIASDRKLDVFDGSAGAILGLIALAARGHEASLERAKWCGDVLINQAQTDAFTRHRTWSWSPGGSRTGFAHGSTGIAHALMQLYRQSGEARYYENAIEAFGHERMLFRQDCADWPESASELNPLPAPAWCHGASGIALSRLAAIGAARGGDFDDLSADLGKALVLVRRGGQAGPHNLCCGFFSRVEVIVELSRCTGRQETLEHARAWALSVVRRICALIEKRPLPAAPVLEPGLWKGIAGIGYTCLRLCEPARFPSLLLLE